MAGVKEPVLSTETVRFEGRDYGFVANDRGVINAVPFFDSLAFMDAGVNWSMPGKLEVRAAILHHWAGWYGPKLGPGATASQEFAQLVACARDHRAKWGIGPGYNLVVFPSNRVWAVGRHGTHRAHTKGRDPETRRPWNEVGRGIAVAGNLSLEPMHGASGVIRAVQEVMSWPGAIPGMAIHEHGITPTVNSAGVMFPQATECPGKNLAAWRAAGGLVLGGVPTHQPDRWQEGYLQGHRTGYGKGAATVAAAYLDAVEVANGEATAAISSPPPPGHVPAAPPLAVAS